MSGEEAVLCCCGGCWAVPDLCCPNIPPGTPRPYIPCDVADALLASEGDPVVFEWAETETCYSLTAQTERTPFLQGQEFSPLGPFFECCEFSPSCCCEAQYFVFTPCPCAPFNQGTVVLGPVPVGTPLPVGCFEFGGCPCFNDPPKGFAFGLCGQFTATLNNPPPGACVIPASQSLCFQPISGSPTCDPDPCCGIMGCCGSDDNCDPNLCELCPCCVAVTVAWGFQNPSPCFNNGDCILCPLVSTTVLCRCPSCGVDNCQWEHRPACDGPIESQCVSGCGSCDGSGPCFYQLRGGSCNAPGCTAGSCCANFLNCSGIGDPDVREWNLQIGIRNPCCGFVVGEGLRCICEPTLPACGGSVPSCTVAGCQNGAAWRASQDCGTWTPCPPQGGWAHVCGCANTTGVVTVG